MRSNRHMGLMLASTAALVASSMVAADTNIGKSYEPKIGRAIKPNPDKQSKAEKKRERKNQQRLKLANR